MNIVLDAGAYLPERAHELDAGYDLKSPGFYTVYSHDACTIDTGVHVEIPEGYVGFLKSKSGLNVKHGSTGEGVIDSGYTGSIKVKLYNHSDFNYDISEGDKIIQLVLLPIVTPELIVVKELKSTERNDNGFGSTGK